MSLEEGTLRLTTTDCHQGHFRSPADSSPRLGQNVVVAARSTFLAIGGTL